MNSLIGLEWRDRNTQRNYPFVDSAEFSIGSAGFFPSDLIIDARIYVRGTYKPATLPYLGKIDIQIDRALLYIYSETSELGVVDIPWTVTPDEATGAFPDFDAATVDLKLIARSIVKNNLSNGVLVINANGIPILQSLAQSTYSLNSNRLSFLPFVCEYLPGPQLTSANGLVGPVILRGETGVRVEAVSPTDIKISIVGDPHFTRNNCLPDQSNSDLLENSLPTFLDQLTVLHYVKNEAGEFIGPYRSKLKINHGGESPRADGSIDFHLVSATGLPREFRPAFRLIVKDNTLIFSMAGA